MFTQFHAIDLFRHERKLRAVFDFMWQWVALAYGRKHGSREFASRLLFVVYTLANLAFSKEAFIAVAITPCSQMEDTTFTAV